jgi:hypothetical protein
MLRPFSLRALATGLFVGLLCGVPIGQTPEAPASAPAAAGTASAAIVSTIADPVQRFLAHPDEKLTQYRARRHLQARNPRFSKEGWLDAWTELDPARGFTYTVIAEDGSGLIRSRVLHRALEAEQEALSAGEVGKSAISAANYQIAFGDHDATAGVDRLRIIPLRKDRMLVDGTISVLAADGELVRIEGRLAKTPSFWTNSVNIVRRYGRIEGVHVPLSIESTANLKIAGDSVFSMTYSYESVNGRRVAAASDHPTTTAAGTPVP